VPDDKNELESVPNRLQDYPTPGSSGTILGGSPEDRENYLRQVEDFEVLQKQRAAAIKRRIRRERIRRALSQRSFFFAKKLPYFQGLPSHKDARFRENIRSEEHFERRLVELALELYVNMSKPDWRLETLEALARTHPKLIKRKKAGRPRLNKGVASPSIKRLATNITTLLGSAAHKNDAVFTMPQPMGTLPLIELILELDKLRQQAGDEAKKANPLIADRLAYSDKRVAEMLVAKYEPNHVSTTSYPDRVNYWAKRISKARSEYRKS
jgi:hypothetical protein